MKKIIFTIFVCMLIIKASIVSYADENISKTEILNLSREFYSQVDTYTTDFVMEIHESGQNEMKGKIYYKSPNLLRIEAKHMYFGFERELLVIITKNSYYYSEVKEKAMGNMEICNAGGIKGKTAFIKKGDYNFQVMVFSPDLKEIIQKKDNKTEATIEIVDLAYFFQLFQPGPYFKNPHLSFKTFSTCYNIQKSNNSNSIVAELINPSKNEIINLLPYKVKCSFKNNGFVSKIETLDSNDQKKAEISYTEPLINPKITDDLFEYHMPLNAFVIDQAEDLKKQ